MDQSKVPKPLQTHENFFLVDFSFFFHHSAALIAFVIVVSGNKVSNELCNGASAVACFENSEF